MQVNVKYHLTIHSNFIKFSKDTPTISPEGDDSQTSEFEILDSL